MKNSTSIVEGLKKESEALQNGTKKRPKLSMSERLDHFLEKVERIDFKTKVYPSYPKLIKELKEKESVSDGELTTEIVALRKQISSFKITRKHYKIICINEVLRLAEVNNWGLCKRHSFIYLYSGEYWLLLDSNELKAFLGKAARKMGINRWDADDEDFIEILFRQFLFKAYLPEPDRDTSQTLINLQNGTYKVSQRGGTLRKFNRKDFLTYQLPFDYNPKASAPNFDKYLLQVLPDVGKQKVLAEYIAYVFVRSMKLEKTLLLYGGGANGKSVFFDIINALLGKDNVTSFSLQSLTDDKGYFRAKIANSLLNYASEINGKLQADIFKQLVSGEPVEARLPYKDPFVMNNYARLLFNCNELPRNVEFTNAFFRRFLIIHFDVTITEHEQDKELSTKIIENELSGVFNWVLDGLKRLLKQRNFTRCEAIENQVKEYRKQSDSVQLFLEESGYIISLENTEPLKDIYRMYKSYALDDMLRPVSKKTFSKRLKAIGFDIQRMTYGMTIYIEKT